MVTETGRFATGAVDFAESRSEDAKCNTLHKIVSKQEDGTKKVTDTAIPSILQQ